jgi:cell division protease FtsH
VLGPRAFGKNEEYVFLGREVNRSQDYSEKTAQLIDTEVDRLLKEAHDKATQLLTENKAAVETLAKLLLDKETVDGVVAEEIVKYGRPRTPEERGEEPPEVPPPPPPTESTEETSAEA